jgi:hypothetical protein
MDWKKYAEGLKVRVGSDKDPLQSDIEQGIGELRDALAVRMGARIVVSDPAFERIVENLDRQRS